MSGELTARAVEFFTFEYAFARDALIASMLIGALCGAVGTFLVLRNLALLGDATGHATLPGVCVAFLLTGTKHMSALLLGALGAGLLAALCVSVLSRGKRARPDAAVGVVLSVFFGLGIVLLSYIQSSPSAAQTGLSTFLFGNAAAVSPEQLGVLAAVGGALVLGLAVFFRPIALVAFDEGFARVSGVRVTWVNGAVLVAIAATIVVSIQAVGVVLVAAMLVIPPSAALFLAKRLPWVVAASAAMGLLSGAVGAFLSFVLEGFGTGPSMVLVAAALFAACLLFGPRGVLLRTLRRRAALVPA